VCSVCNEPGSAGTCQKPTSDPACGTLTCPSDTECLAYQGINLENNCAGVGQCEDTANCQRQPEDSSVSCLNGTGQCDGQGECVVPDKKGLGETCLGDDECGSVHCSARSDGTNVCCDSACNGTCQACGNDGSCSATPADDAQCGVIDCPSSTSCTTYPADVTTNRCASFGQCYTQQAKCGPTQKPPTTNCGSSRECDGSGTCQLVCPTNSGSGRTCTSDCPCSAGQGVCNSNTDCNNGLQCAANGGAKFGFNGSKSCVPTHCNNDVQDAGETAVDCGADCGCAATYETININGQASGAYVDFNAMSGNGSKFVGWVRENNGNSDFPAVINSSGTVSKLPS
jgi:hypothetical protein